ncbi:PREDICTED: uncharacterized protein LOC104737926 [Camelina sativa]|uniref:Uncharacterized protein LOC104737926 n=1 Tax=Camelina sativa TaxID=90675 RepID=A0ABM0VI13_CAMSA|nr:PREDICTED: uncharacterized protein LOC104737926 [Camelina sativa]
MSLLLNQPSKVWLRKHTLVRSSPLASSGFSTTLLQSPPCFVAGPDPYGNLKYDTTIERRSANRSELELVKKLPVKSVFNDAMVVVGSSHGWALNKGDGSLRLQDDLIPVASVTDPKRIPLPPFVTLPQCQTQIITNVSMSSSSPGDEDCVVAVKFLGPQISFCRPAHSNSEWINIRISNPCFSSSRVMFSEKHNKFCMPGSGGHLIGSWYLGKHNDDPKLQTVHFKKLPKLNKAKRKLLHSCYTSEYLVESRFTGETFMVKCYKKTAKIVDGIAKMETKALMVFKLDEEGNAVYNEDIRDLIMFLSHSEPFCVPASYLPLQIDNSVVAILDVDELALVNMHEDFFIDNEIDRKIMSPYFIPPQFI